MISEQYRCIFVEVPKTGSTSVRSIVGEPLRPHLNIWQIAQGMVPEQFEQFYKFGFVRNPWDRAVALYERREGMQLKSKLSFEEFIDWMKFASSTCLHPVPHRYQLDWFVNPHGDIIVNRIGRFENLANDWAEIASRIGARPDLPMLNFNTNRKRHYSEYFSKRSRLIVATRFAVDIEYFGYEFDS
ncbi:MAG: hypothetical protein H7293_11005 [Candidatus Saccharibacteria bacterium]|nr:hypothetical protein [Rhodoferax sp.]